VELGEKGFLSVTHTPLKPLHPVSTRRGHLSELLEGTGEEYLRVILTDETDAPNAFTRLRYRYPNLLRLEYDNLRVRVREELEISGEEELSPMQLLEEFYTMRNDRPLTEAQKALALQWMEEIWEDDL
jgi:exonuclease SbcD